MAEEKKLAWVNELFKRYESDRSLYVKIEQLCDAAKTRPDFPFCRNLVEGLFKEFVGVELSVMFNDTLGSEGGDEPATARIRNKIEDALDNLGGDLELKKSFVAETVCFLRVYEPFLLALANLMSVLEPSHLASVSFTSDVSHTRTIVRFMTNDGKHLDLLLSRDQLDSVIKGLENVRRRLHEA